MFASQCDPIFARFNTYFCAAACHADVMCPLGDPGNGLTMNGLRLAAGLTSILVALACTSEARRGQAALAPLPKTIQNGDVQLAFTLDLPEGAGPFPAVVCGHGSGPITRHQLGW